MISDKMEVLVSSNSNNIARALSYIFNGIWHVLRGEGGGVDCMLNQIVGGIKLMFMLFRT